MCHGAGLHPLIYTPACFSPYPSSEIPQKRGKVILFLFWVFFGGGLGSMKLHYCHPQVLTLTDFILLST